MSVPRIPSHYFGLWFEYGSQTYAPDSSLGAGDGNPYKISANHLTTTLAFRDAYNAYPDCRVLVKHRPPGEANQGVGDMWLDSLLYIQDDPYWSTHLDEWEESDAILAADCPEAIVIEYYGTQAGEMASLIAAANTSGHNSRANASIARSINNPQKWIAFDATASNTYYPDDGIAATWIQGVAASLQAQDRNILGESMAREDGNAWSYNQGTLLTEIDWLNKRTSSSYRRRSTQHTIVRPCTGAGLQAIWDADPYALEKYMRSIVHYGHTPVLGTTTPVADFAQAFRDARRGRRTARIYDNIDLTSRPQATPMPGFEGINLVYQSTNQYGMSEAAGTNPVSDNEAAFKAAIADWTDAGKVFHLDWESADFHVHADDADWETNMANWASGIAWLRDVHGAAAQVVPYGAGVWYVAEFDPDDIDVAGQITHAKTNLLPYIASLGVSGIAMTAYPTHRDLEKNIRRMEKVKQVLEVFGVPIWAYVWDRWPAAGAPGTPGSGKLPASLSRAIARWCYENTDHVIAWDKSISDAWDTPNTFLALDKAQYGGVVQ